MTGDKSMLTNITYSDGGSVAFGDNSKGYIIGKGDVSNYGTPNLPLISNVLLVKNLKHNLLSINQLCDKGFKISFSENKCSILDQNQNLIFEGNRDRNIYVLNMKINHNLDMCLIAIENDPWLWLKWFYHINFKAIHKLSKNDLVKGLPKMNFKINHICDACQLGKWTKSSFKSKKVISTL